jgi:hypothetical protein
MIRNFPQSVWAAFEERIHRASIARSLQFGRVR